MKITFLTQIPTPYMQDLFAAMNADGRFRLRVHYMETRTPDTYWDSSRLPGYADTLPGYCVVWSGARLHWNYGLRGALLADAPDVVVVGGYGSFTCQAAMLLLSATRIPWVFWGEIPGVQKRGGMGTLLRNIAQTPLRWAHGLAGIGCRATEAYRTHGMHGQVVQNIPYFCDLAPFRPGAGRARKTDGPVRFLYCGQLIERKGVDLLLKAFIDLAANADVRLTLVGEGPLRGGLEASVPEQMRQRIVFTGFQQVAELPRYFADADVFVLPSRHDGWGVVVNQAVAAGLPIIATESVGAAHDLVEQGANGLVVPPDDVDALRQALACFASNRAQVDAFGHRSRQISQAWTPECGVDRWHQFLSEVLKNATSRRARGRSACAS